MASQVLRMFRIKNGLLGVTCFSIALAGYTVIKGPYIEDRYFRYALAGTAATVATEFALHGIDTLNMRSKALSGTHQPNLLLSLFKLEGFMSLFRGVNAVVYGYAASSILYFYAYAYLRDQLYEKCRKDNQAKIDSFNELKEKLRENLGPEMPPTLDAETPVQTPSEHKQATESEVTFG